MEWDGFLTRMNSYEQGSRGSMPAGASIFLFATAYKPSLLSKEKSRAVSPGYGTQGMKLTLQGVFASKIALVL